MNPLFPLNEYVPDGEPHVFGDRVYLYGSPVTMKRAARASARATIPCGARP